MRTANEALATFRRWNSNRVNWCLWTIQEVTAAPHAFPGAIQQWNGATHKHRGDKNPPAGVPIFWEGGTWGHIAMATGNGQGMRSTDWPYRAHVGEGTIDALSRAWGKQYLGWTEDLGGQLIPGIHAPSSGRSRWAGGDVYRTKLRYGTRNSDSVRRLQYRLNHVRGLPGPKLPITGYYGPTTARKVREFLKRMGHNRRANTPLNKQSFGRGEMNRLFGPHYKTHG